MYLCLESLEACPNHPPLLLTLHRKEHVPLVDRTEALPPPSLVVVMGPKGCGKTTLIRSLVKYYTGQNLSDVLGRWEVGEGGREGGEGRFGVWSTPSKRSRPLPPSLP